MTLMTATAALAGAGALLGYWGPFDAAVYLSSSPLTVAAATAIYEGVKGAREAWDYRPVIKRG